MSKWENINKKWLVLLALVVAIGLGYASYRNADVKADPVFSKEPSLVEQNIVGMLEEPEEVTKLYYKDQLIGVIHDVSILDKTIKEAFDNYYASDFGDSNLRYNDDIYLYKEKTNIDYENKDLEIGNYLFDNDLFLVEVYQVTIGEDQIVYVKDIDSFKNSLRKVAMMFIDEETFLKLEKEQEIVPLSKKSDKKSNDSQNVNIYLVENITYVRSAASASVTLKNDQEIIDFLCYGGSDEEREYVTVQKYDTIQAIAKQYNMTAEQLVMINENLKSENQAISEGMQLNVSKFHPPVTFVVEKERYVQEVVYQPANQIIRDASMIAGSSVIEQEGNDGYDDVIYTEIYVNGELTSYKEESRKTGLEAKPKIVRIGTTSIYIDNGNYSFRLPVDNPTIICDFYCYPNHHGVDFRNRYNYYSEIYACGDGVITSNRYQWDMGWYVQIDHGDGIVMRYLHMSHQSPLPVGTIVYKSQYIGDVGMTGTTTAPHVHLAVDINGIMVNPCTVVPCSLAG